MKLTISRESLITPLQSIAGVVEKKQTMPVLSNVLLEAEDNTLTLTGTNMEVELVGRVTPVHVDQPGRITVPARKLSDICRALGDDAPIDLALEGDRLHVRAGNSHFTLSTLPAEHFPNVEDEPESFRLELPQKELGRMLDATAFAMAQQDVRYYLNGLLLEVDSGHVRVVATDGHRLAMAHCDMQTGCPEPRQVIVPRKGVLELARLLDDVESPVTLVIGDNHLRATVGAYTFTSKLIEGKFPDYNRVIPRGGDKFVLADRSTLKNTLQRAGILSHENIRGVRLNLSPGQLQVIANNPDQEQAEDTLPVDYQGESLQIGFNVGYLIDVMNALDDAQVKLTLSNPNSSALIEAENDNSCLYVVMPMRL
ncbi:DNA polymerase III subunit beta [Marinobacter halophilus]|uniref:Beta sliding clamp n=1 Tax=Marinobacter halophilus TaxID=1323740 RepID=A0A2T1KIZ8_9GAMM|nr:DNA polymerase III subunit beta [Marinobacter halophilus]PSF09980.1 DNA polymerase III subunit beta [Marinobacter halophilus]GGC66677.1 DNA polymerase III subunit beta [Marinobacter halophilus]